MESSRRSLLIGVIAVALCAGGGVWWSYQTSSRYLSGETADFEALFAAPPAANSDAARRELDELLDLQNHRTPAEVAAAQADRKKDVSRFYPVLGLDPVHPPDMPALQKFTDRAEAEIGPYVRKAKAKFRRLRPYEIEPKLKPCIGDVKGDLSYPSGHATYGYLMGYLLSELVPERRLLLMRRAEEFARQRLVCGIHFRSDIEAGQRGAYFLFGKMHESAAYREDAIDASNELRAVLGLAPRPPRPY
jgi:acid phosphatase (class A)